jgi:hypothetical protein
MIGNGSLKLRFITLKKIIKVIIKSVNDEGLTFMYFDIFID